VDGSEEALRYAQSEAEVERQEKRVHEVRQRYDKDLLESTQFAKEHAADLHDIAVTEARLGGVAINIDQNTR
jgi:hypothetical protein